MNISTGLYVQKALAEEVARLRKLADRDAWEYRVSTPDAKWMPTFNLEENQETIKKLVRLHARIGRAIAKTNLEVDLVGINNEDFKDWF
jgi:hypothetical protein